MSLLIAVALSMLQLSVSIPESSAGCVECHRQERIAAASLRMWEESSHAVAGVACAHCHLTDPSHQGLSALGQGSSAPSLSPSVPAATPRSPLVSRRVDMRWPVDLERVRRMLTGRVVR